MYNTFRISKYYGSTMVDHSRTELWFNHGIFKFGKYHIAQLCSKRYTGAASLNISWVV